MVAEKGDHMLMSFLLDLLSPKELSAIINEQDDNGNTVLHIACGLEAQPTVERVTTAKVMICQLLKKGADERIKNRENKVAYNFVPKSCLVSAALLSNEILSTNIFTDTKDQS